MTFRATLMVQGAAIWAPDRERKGIQVLWPNRDFATQNGVRDPAGDSICQHHAVVQYRARDLGTSKSHKWKTFQVKAHCVKVVSDSKVPVTPFTKIRGIPKFAGLISRAIPGGRARLSFPPGALMGGLWLDRGKIEPDVEWEEEYAFRRFNNQLTLRGRKGKPFTSPGLYSNVHRVMLGEVSKLEVERYDIARERSDKIVFNPIDKEIEVWIRHFCDRKRPDTESCKPEPLGAWDIDFVLNYTLHKRAREKMFNGDQADFLLPQAAKSWLSNNPVGDCTNRCLCSGSGHAKNFLDNIG